MTKVAKQNTPLTQLLRIAEIENIAHLAELRAASLFIEHGSAITRRVIRSLHAAAKQRRGKPHIGTQGALAFLVGLGQEFAQIAHDAENKLIAGRYSMACVTKRKGKWGSISETTREHVTGRSQPATRERLRTLCSLT